MFVEILISAGLVISGIFGIVGSFGLIKLPHPMMRLHAPTKATTLGVGGALIASMLYFFHELMITVFLFLTAPITGHFIAKTHIHRNENKDSLPETGTARPWATFDHPQQEQEQPEQQS